MSGWNVTQEGQIARITTALGPDQAFLESFTVVEGLSEPFRITCQAFCSRKDDDIGPPRDFMEHRGSGLSIEVGLEKQPQKLIDRAFHGVLTDVTYLGVVRGADLFELTARPWFWVLSLGRDSRIFQAKSVRDIIKAVFDAAGVNPDQYSFAQLRERGTIVREYTVQFEESDFDFVSRLMEEEGIYYFFAHTANAHVMTLCDTRDSHKKFSEKLVFAYEELSRFNDPHLSAWTNRLRPTIHKYESRDQHFAKFGDAREASISLPEQKGTIKPQFFEYPGGHAYLSDDGSTDGNGFAALRLKADMAEGLLQTGFGDTFAVAVGASADVTVVGRSAEMLVVRAIHTMSGQDRLGNEDSDSVITTVEFDSVVLAQGYAPPRVTPKPVARGPQVATVVGKAGQEIMIDQYGRVKVQFPWDRYGKSDENSSCWIRVSSAWAGPSMGEYMNPRIGQEVLISYIDGDMDRPVITGRVFDSKNIYTPPKSETDYVSDRSAQTGWISQTVGGPSGQGYEGAVVPPTDNPGFNAILFDDRSGKEQVFIRGQRDARTTIYRDRMEVIHRDEEDYIGRHLKTEVETGNETHNVVKGKRTTTINQDETLTVEQGNRAMTIQTGNETLKVSKGDMSTEVSMGNQATAIKMGDQSTDVSLGNISVKADLGKIDIEAMQSITLKVGQSTVVIDQMGVTIKGMMIKTEATLMHDTKALMTSVKGDAMLILKGGITMIN